LSLNQEYLGFSSSPNFALCIIKSGQLINRSTFSLPRFLLEFSASFGMVRDPADDNGNYACTAMNPLGAATTSGNLTVSSTNRGFRY